MSTTSIYRMITERITDLLEHGVIPWRQPWSLQGLPANLISRRPYRGINVFVLSCMRYGSRYWLTYRQARQLGGYVLKGEAATPVIFWKWFRATSPDDSAEEAPSTSYPLLRYYHVFNAQQCVGIDVPDETPVAAIAPDERIEPAEAIVAGMPDPPTIREDREGAFYSSRDDLVNVPPMGRFSQLSDYYSVLYHELTHSTGHPRRLARPAVVSQSFFGSFSYCQEELVAEMGAAFLCGHAGICNHTVDNSAAYINGWLEQLAADLRLVVTAAAQAQRAADFILGKTFSPPSKAPTASPESTPKQLVEEPETTPN